MDDRALGSVQSGRAAAPNGSSHNGSHVAPARAVQPVHEELEPVPAGASQQSSSADGSGGPAVQPVQRPPHAVTFDDADDLDVPDFLK